MKREHENLRDIKLLKKGGILVSQPFGDNDEFGEHDDFYRTVILLVTHSKEGSMGLILNKPITIDEDVLTAGPFNYPLGYGGPLDSVRLFALYSGSLALANSKRVKTDLHVGGDLESIIEKIACGDIETKDVRFFLGYAGWDKGQLEAEVEMGEWLVKDAESSDIVRKYIDKSSWEDILLEIGGEYAQWVQYPSNPSLN
ncbi:MAG: YqgE/AlgH family protein [Bacteroidales bacterium]